MLSLQMLFHPLCYIFLQTLRKTIDKAKNIVYNFASLIKRNASLAEQVGV